MRHFKILGLALLAVFSMAAVMASMASASEPKTELTALNGATKEADVFLEAEADATGGTQEFSVNTGIITCTVVKIPETTVPANITTVEIHPEFGSAATPCKAFGLKATIETTGCNFIFHLTETKTKGEAITASTTIVCEAGKQITITPTGVKCVVTVGSQTVKGADVIFTNVGTGNTADLTLAANINPTKTEGAGITYTETGTECKETIKGQHGGTFSNGKYVGNTTIKGFLDTNKVKGSQIGLKID